MIVMTVLVRSAKISGMIVIVPIPESMLEIGATGGIRVGGRLES